MNVAKSELEQLISDIKKGTTQISVNKVDEVRVMKSMLNDPEFSIGVYDRSSGYLGQKCPHDEAIKFVKNIVQDATGLDSKDAKHLADSYKFTTRDAAFLVSNMKDYLSVYTTTGRKITVIQNATTDAALYLKEVKARTKNVPDKENGGVKKVKCNNFNKLVSSSKFPRYTL